MSLDPELLRTFVAVAESGGFTRAAERLHKTQSTVSQQLRRLEERVGTPLLLRNTRTLTVTDQGELLLGYARRLLALQGEALAALAGTRTEGRVSFGCGQDVADGGLADMLAHFTRLHPGIGVEMRVDANCLLREAVARGELDLAVVLQEPGSGGEPVATLERVWVAGPAFRHPADGPLPLVLFAAPCIFREAALHALEREGLGWRMALTTPSLAGLRAAVRAGLGVSVRTARWLEADLRVLEGELPELPPVELALHVGRAENGAAQRLLESVREALDGR